MESKKPKVALYAKRSFGDKLNASFDFIKENWKPLLKYSTYLILPLCLVQALSLNGLVGGILSISQLSKGGADMLAGGSSSMGAMFFINYGAYVILALLGTALLYSLVFAMIRTYSDSEGRLEGVTLSALKPLLFRNLKRVAVLMLVTLVLGILFVVIMGLLIAFAVYSLILIIPLFIACCIPLTLWAPIYLFEEISLMDSLSKAFRLGFATWGGTFLILFIMGLVGSVLQGVTMVPWYIATLVKFFFSMSDTGSETTVSVGYSFLLYVLGIVQVYGTFISMIFSLVGLAYQYGHASEVVDSITVENDIDNFDKF